MPGPGSILKDKGGRGGQGDPKESERQGEIKKRGFVKQMQNLFLGEDSLSARQSVTVINEGGRLSQRCEQQSETFALLFTAFEPWYFKNCLFCLNSHRDVQAGANLSFNRQFYDEHWSKHRVVTCMDWSLQVRCEAGRYVFIFHIPSNFSLQR